MAQELRRTTIHLKSLNQDISDPIIAGGGDANGYSLRIIFDPEAAAQFTPETQVYLKWRHQQLNNRGLNQFRQIDSECDSVWEINWPHNMLHEGDVLCSIELIDEISIAQSNNFIVHVLQDADDGSQFIVSNDYTEFQNAIIEMNSFSQKTQEQLEMQKEEFENIKQSFAEIETKINAAYNKVIELYDAAKETLSNLDQLVTTIKSDAAADAQIKADKSLADAKTYADEGLTAAQDDINAKLQSIQENLDTKIEASFVESAISKAVGEIGEGITVKEYIDTLLESNKTNVDYTSEKYINKI